MSQKSPVKSVSTRRGARPRCGGTNRNSLRSSAASAVSALKNPTQRRRERKDSLRMNNTKNSPGQCQRTAAAERPSSATPGRGIQPTRDFPANPNHFPALAAVILFGGFTSTVCINNLKCSVIGNLGESLSELGLPLRQRLALCKQRTLVKLA